MKLNLDTFALILDCFDKKAYINVVMQTCTDLYALGLPKLLADYREPDSLPKALTFLHYLLEKPNRRPPCLYSLQLPTFELGSRRNVYKEHAAEFMATLSNVFYKTQNLRRLILDLSSLPELDMADLMPLQESCRVLVDLSLSGVSASTLLAFLPSCTFPLRHIRIGVPSASNSSTSTVRMDVLLRPFSATLEYVELKVYNWSISNSAYLVWPNVQTLKTFHPPEGGGLSNSFPNLRRLEIQADSTAHSASPQREYHWEHLDLVKLPPRVLRKMLADTAVRKLEILDDLPIDDRVADALARARPVWLKMSAEVAEAIEVAPKLPLALVAGTLERLRLNLDFAPNMHTRGYTKEILDELLGVIAPLTELTDLELNYRDYTYDNQRAASFAHAFHLRLAWHMPNLQHTSHVHNNSIKTYWVILRGFQKGKPTVDLVEIEEEEWVQAGFGWGKENNEGHP